MPNASNLKGFPYPGSLILPAPPSAALTHTHPGLLRIPGPSTPFKDPVTQHSCPSFHKCTFLSVCRTPSQPSKPNPTATNSWKLTSPAAVGILPSIWLSHLIHESSVCRSVGPSRLVAPESVTISASRDPDTQHFHSLVGSQRSRCFVTVFCLSQFLSACFSTHVHICSPPHRRQNPLLFHTH